MSTIRRKLSGSFLISSIITIVFIIIFVNIAINKQFVNYMNEVQNKRYNRIVTYFEEVYKKEGAFDNNSGNELIHEAFMNNYCLTLMDSNKEVIWGMNPKDITEDFSFNNMHKEEKGFYTSNIFEIKNKDKVVGYVEIGQYSPILLTEEDTNFITSINKVIIWSAFITIGIGIIISTFLAKQFSKPISEVSEMSTKLSRGNFNIKNDSTTKIKEINDLKVNMNSLAEKLKNQDLLRRKLISDISHEIRTPLNILQNNLEAMVDGIFPITTERLIKLNSEVVRFSKLLNNLDQLKAFESESNKLNLVDVDIEEVTLEVYKQFKIEAKNKNIALTCSIQNENNYIVKGDKDKLKQVIINIINNAIKFTNDYGEVNIYLKKEEEKIVFIVRDNGIGISKEDLPYIFERLYRGDKSRNYIKGNGIGLAIVKSILESHNAKIEAKSKIGKGSTFTITF
ncbi:HAMP domain-containing sensor histidine kinase [Clostridium sp.]|uniref:HAMP domain-containing sensor histidine kinase n=1 Tax=Clostridium sp. TaxID=1506 RepID=UPI003F32A66A